MSGAGQGAIQASRLGFAFDGAPVFEAVDLEARPGALTAILGPSGCGKTTLLRALAGLLAPSEGAVSLPESIPGRAAVGVVFQDPRLLPWMTVRGNLEFALEAAGVPKSERPARYLPLLERVGLSDALDRRPGALSGGMAQRTALARALALRPRALFLDEPFAAVDPMLRERLQADLQALLAGADTAAVMVTHDVGEALVLGDEVAVLSARPARVVARLTVDAPRPRGEDFRLSPGFLELQREIRAALE